MVEKSYESNKEEDCKTSESWTRSSRNHRGCHNILDGSPQYLGNLFVPLHVAVRVLKSWVVSKEDSLRQLQAASLGAYPLIDKSSV